VQKRGALQRSLDVLPQVARPELLDDRRGDLGEDLVLRPDERGIDERSEDCLVVIVPFEADEVRQFACGAAREHERSVTGDLSRMRAACVPIA
jgi:hypothetical protein